MRNYQKDRYNNERNIFTAFFFSIFFNKSSGLIYLIYNDLTDADFICLKKSSLDEGKGLLSFQALLCDIAF